MGKAKNKKANQKKSTLEPKVRQTRSRNRLYIQTGLNNSRLFLNRFIRFRKDKNLCLRDCKKHQFLFRRLKSSQYKDHSQEIPGQVQKKYCNTFLDINYGNFLPKPALNLLHNEKVPLFMISSDAKQSQKIKKFQQLFDKKNQYTQKLDISQNEIDNNVKFPIPKYNDVCKICNQRQKLKNKQQYLNHIETSSHITNLKNQRSTKWIQDLIQKFNLQKFNKSKILIKQKGKSRRK